MNEVVPIKAWVVFTGQSELKSLRFLKKGFRHCFVVFHDGQCWQSVDPLATRMEVCVHRHMLPDFDLPRWLTGQGHHVVPAIIAQPQRPAPLMFFTCVEVVKRMIGLHSRWIITPWQLYRHLAHNIQNNNLMKGV